MAEVIHYLKLYCGEKHKMTYTAICGASWKSGTDNLKNVTCESCKKAIEAAKEVLK